MLTLLSEMFAPITTRIGFLAVPLPEAAEAFGNWMREVNGPVQMSRVGTELSVMFRSLEPLTVGHWPRVLLVESRDRSWTAYFDCLASPGGGNAENAVAVICREIRCRGIAITTEPHTYQTGLEAPGRYGQVEFQMFGPLPTDFLNYVRTLSLTFDESRWRFDVAGTVQDFEHTGQYESRRVRDRFNTAMVAEYCEALGVRPFDATYYSQSGVLIEARDASQGVIQQLSLEEVQKRDGIIPGTADGIQG